MCKGEYNVGSAWCGDICQPLWILGHQPKQEDEIIEGSKLGNQIEDRRESLITYRTISEAHLLFASLINAVVTLVYCICNARILTRRVFADTADCVCVCMCVLVSRLLSSH